MTAIDTLYREHRVIEQVLDCLDSIARDAAEAKRLDGEAARDAIAFFRGFADACHHAKEEHELFPMLEARGMSPTAGPSAVMRIEHAFGRDMVMQMDGAIGGAAEGRPESLTIFLDCAREYGRFLREHIDREDRCLFPAAQQILDPSAEEELQRRFELADEHQYAGRREEGLRLAEKLGERLAARSVP